MFMPALLDLFPGMPLMVTANIATALGVANGTSATLEAIIWDQALEFETLTVPLAQQTIQVDVPTTARPKGLLLRLPDRGSEIIKAGWPPGCIVVGLRQLTVTVKLPSIGRIGESVQFRVSVSQFPVVPRMACTGHKVQGLTMTSILVPRWQGATGQWAYVVLSRVRTLGGLFMLERPEAGFWSRSGPGRELLADDKRLVLLAEQTKGMLGAAAIAEH